MLLASLVAATVFLATPGELMARPLDALVMAQDTTGGRATERPAPKKKSGSRYIRGPRGGCYYLTGSGRKQYVDRSMCD